MVRPKQSGLDAQTFILEEEYQTVRVTASFLSLSFGRRKDAHSAQNNSQYHVLFHVHRKEQCI